VEKTASTCSFPAWVVYSLYSIHTLGVLTPTTNMGAN